jgi:hypothetical protein
MGRLLRASAIWNFHTYGKFKNEFKGTLATVHHLAMEYI